MVAWRDENKHHRIGQNLLIERPGSVQSFQIQYEQKLTFDWHHIEIIFSKFFIGITEKFRYQWKLYSCIIVYIAIQYSLKLLSSTVDYYDNVLTMHPIIYHCWYGCVCIQVMISLSKLLWLVSWGNNQLANQSMTSAQARL